MRGFRSAYDVSAAVQQTELLTRCLCFSSRIRIHDCAEKFIDNLAKPKYRPAVLSQRSCRLLESSSSPSTSKSRHQVSLVSLTGGSAIAVATDESDYKQEVRFAVVMYGGVSLAIYINGVAQELLKLVRSTAQNSGKPLTGTERIYRQVGFLLASELD